MAKKAFDILSEASPEAVEYYSDPKGGLPEAQEAFRKISTGTENRRTPGTFGGQNPFLLTMDSAKLEHNSTSGLRKVQRSLQAIQYLDPSDSSGLCNTCGSETKGCSAVCLRESGRMGKIPGVGHAPHVRTNFLVQEPEKYLGLLNHSIARHEALARRMDKQSIVRLNGTSDIDFDRLPAGAVLIGGHPRTTFSEYTKHGTRDVLPQETASPFKNYYRIHSLSENTTAGRIRQITEAGGNMAAPFYTPSKGFEFPDEMRITDKRGDSVDLPVVKETVGRGKAARRVSVGDLHDQRVHDPQIGGIVALRYKVPTNPEVGSMPDSHGFVRDIEVPDRSKQVYFGMGAPRINQINRNLATQFGGTPVSVRPTTKSTSVPLIPE
jgi:hypothetical protein